MEASGPSTGATRLAEPVETDTTVGRVDVPGRPRLGAAVELVGELDGDAFQHQQWLVMRETRFVQVSELLYRILQCSDGANTLDDIASSVGSAIGRGVSRDDVEHLLREKLIPLRLIQGDQESVEESRSTSQLVRSPFAVNFRARVDGRHIDPVASVLRVLHAPVVMAPLLLGALAAHIWLYGVHGATGAIREFVSNPAVMMIVLPVMLLAAAFHEFGHASALRYEGGRARAMGAGLYLVFPALYTDVSEAYRLNRWQRLRVDLGGPYFHVVFGLLATGLYAATGEKWLLTVAVLADVEVLRQFMPIGRLDGHWILADLTGMPDFLSRIVPFATSLLPIPLAEDRSAPPLKRRARRVFLLYLAAFAIGFPVFIIYTLSHLPSLAVAGWGTARVLVRFFSASQRVGNYVQMVYAAFQLVFLALEAAGVILFFYLLAWRPARRMWVHSREQIPAFRRMTRASLFALLGGVTISVGALYPWLSIRVAFFGLTRDVNGVHGIDGRTLFVAGVAVLLAGILLLLSWTLKLRRAAVAIAIIGGLLAAGIAGYHLAKAPGMVEHRVRAIVASSTGHEPTAHELDVTRRTLADLGFDMDAGYGLFIVAAGALFALGGGLVGLSGIRTLRRSAGAPNVEAPVSDAPPVDERRRKVFMRTMSLAVTAAVVVAVGFVLWPSSGPVVPTSNVAAPPSSGDLIWSANTEQLPERLHQLGLPMLPEEALAYHIHQHLSIYIDGRKVIVPQGIGIDQARGFITVLHTHSYDEIIHVEAPARTTYTLGQFFGVWGVRLDGRCIGNYCNHGASRLRVFVNGQPESSDPASIPLRAHDEIVVTFGTTAQLPQPIPAVYRFPPGE
jgi:putative peptide zinc metalloprotease protein